MSLFNVHSSGDAKLGDQSDEIFPGSPMALVGVFTNVVQALFSGLNGEKGPYIWTPDAQPLEIDPDNPEVPQSKIYVESQYTEEPDARDRANPSIFVEKGPTQMLKIGMGHRAGIDMPSMTETFWAMADVPINFMCVARERGTSATVADLVFMYMAGSENHIRAAFSIHSISPPTIETTQVYRQSGSQIETWVTNVVVLVKIRFAWRTRPIAPILKQIAATYEYGPNVVKTVSTETRKP